MRCVMDLFEENMKVLDNRGLETGNEVLSMTYLKNYFAKVAEKDRTSAAIAYMAALDAVACLFPKDCREHRPGA